MRLNSRKRETVGQLCEAYSEVHLVTCLLGKVGGGR